jgi:hypothetical protein
MSHTKRIMRKNLPEIALASGVDVKVKGGKTVFSKKVVVVVMYESGALVRGDVDLTIAKAMTVTEAAKCLGLG